MTEEGCQGALAAELAPWMFSPTLESLRQKEEQTPHGQDAVRNDRSGKISLKTYARCSC
jgi:hypothetical protein